MTKLILIAMLAGGLAFTLMYGAMRTAEKIARAQERAIVEQIGW